MKTVRRLQTVPYRPSGARLNVIDCRPGFEGPYFSGEGPEDSVCGKCESVLIRGRVVACLILYICCPSCGLYNMADGDAGA